MQQWSGREELGGRPSSRTWPSWLDYVPNPCPAARSHPLLSSTYRGLTQGSTREHSLLWGPSSPEARRRQLSPAASRPPAERAAPSRACSNCAAAIRRAGMLHHSHVDPHYPTAASPSRDAARPQAHLARKGSPSLGILASRRPAQDGGSSLVYDLTASTRRAAPPGLAGVVGPPEKSDLLDPASLSTFRDQRLRVKPYGRDASHRAAASSCLLARRL